MFQELHKVLAESKKDEIYEDLAFIDRHDFDFCSEVDADELQEVVNSLTESRGIQDDSEKVKVL